MFPSDTDRQTRGATQAAIRDVVEGRLTRSAFLRRAAAIGLSGSMATSILSACGSDSEEQPAAGGKETAGTSADALMKLVYPDGLTSDETYKGPNGGAKVGVLPPDAFDGVDAKGIRNWNFKDLKATKDHRIAYAHFSSKWDLMVESIERFNRFAKQAGFTVETFDNNFDADQAIKNADSIVAQQFDFVIESQIFPDANKAIDRKLKAANIPVIYFAVEGPEGSMFMDAGNFRMCEATGEWLGTYAKDNWDGKVDLVLMAAQPRAGKYVGQREEGYKAGLRKVLPDIPDSAFVAFDSQGLLEEAQKKAADVLTSKAGARNIIGCGTNDDAAVGIVRALEAAKRTDTAAVGGQAGQASAVAELKKGSSPFKVSAFQDVEALLWMAAIGVLQLEGGTPAPVNFQPFYLTTSENVDAFPPQAGTLTKA